MENISLKIPIQNRSTPYIFCRISDSTHNYRVSCNYEYLNTTYNLKINFYRNLDISKNKFFTLTKDKDIELTNYNDWQHWSLTHDSSNYIDISRLVIVEKDSCNSIIVFKRIFEEEYNCSVFFCSDKYFNIQQFIESQYDSQLLC